MSDTTVDMDTARTYFLSREELAATEAKVAKVNSRAEARGFTGRFDIEAVASTRSYTNAGGINVTQHGFDVTLTGTVHPRRYEVALPILATPTNH